MRELTINEIDQVSGGFVPALIAGAALLGSAIVSAIAVLSSDDCTTITTKSEDGRTTTSVRTCQ